MQYLFLMVIITYTALLVAHKQEVHAFVERCEAKGGVTLRGYRTTGGWIGCYTNLVEVENER